MVEERSPRYVPLVLDRAQIDFAKEIVDEFHPISKTPFHVAYPWIGWFCKCSSCCGGGSTDLVDNSLDKSNTLSEALIKDKKAVIKGKNGKEIVLKKKPKKKQKHVTPAEESDPINLLGFGIVAYRDLLYNMIFLFATLTFFMLPVLIIYGNGQGYAGAEVQSYEMHSIGNLGYSSVDCSTIPLGVGTMNIDCSYGKVGEIIDFGVQQPINNLTQEVCVNTEANAMCSPTNLDLSREINTAVNTSSYRFLFNTTTLYPNGAPNTECTKPTATVFVQYTCIQTEAQQNVKYQAMTVAVSCGCFISLLFSLFVVGFGARTKLTSVQWDMSTCTVADFAVEFPILEESYSTWYTDVYCAEEGDRDNKIPVALSLKRFLTKKIEKFLTDDRMEAAGIDPSKKGKKSRALKRLNNIEEVKIADMQFGYTNQVLLKALTTRGTQIAHNKFSEVRDEDEKIETILRDSYDEVTRPTAAFIVFEEEEGAATAQKATGKCGREIMGQVVKFTQASEPTDIIWENRHFVPGFSRDILCCKTNSSQSVVCREIFGYLFVCIALSFSFLFILYLASLEIKFGQVFPPQNCQMIQDTYGENLEEYAYFDYVFVSNTQNMASSGCLQCFCQEQVDTHGYDYAMNTNFTAEGGESHEICYTYLSLDAKATILTSSFSYILIGFNYVLRTIVIMVVEWIGYATQTAMLERITTVTFLCQFFNTAFILMLVNADLSEQPITGIFVWGQNGDFNASFFKTIGNQLVSTMMFNMYYPILEWIMYWGMRLGFRILNRACCTCDTYSTKSTSIKAYQTIYSGPSYYIHYKYSTVLNTVFVCFMFGFGMPIFFPIGLGSMAVLYFVEKSALYWSYQQPPMYNEHLNDSVLAKLKYAPCFFLAFGYWMASNNQLLSNEHLTPIQNESDTRITGHVITDIFSSQGYACPTWALAATFYFTIFFCWFGTYIMPAFEYCCPSIKIAEIEVDQPIDSYFASCDDEDRAWTVCEEDNARSNLKNLKIMLDRQLDAMRNTPLTKGATLQGVHSYDILANPLYADRFQYVNASIPDRTQYIIDDDDDESNDAIQSDIVRAVLNLPFMTEKKAKNFSFSASAYSAELLAKLTMSNRMKDNDEEALVEAE